MLGTGQVTGGNNNCIAICDGCFYRHYQTGYQSIPCKGFPGSGRPEILCAGTTCTI